LGFRVGAEHLFQFFVGCGQLLRRNSQKENASARSFNEYEPAKILVPRDEQSPIFRCTIQEDDVWGTGKIQFGGGYYDMAESAKKAPCDCINVLVKEKSHEGTPT
jgi:hypothetical protein